MALQQSSLASRRLAQMVEESNVAPFTLEHLELQVAHLLRHFEHTPSGPMLRAVSALRDQVAVLLNGRRCTASPGYCLFC